MSILVSPELRHLAALLDTHDPHRARGLAQHFGGVHALLEAPTGALRTAGLSSSERTRIRAALHFGRARPRHRPKALKGPVEVAGEVPHLTFATREEVWAIPVDIALVALDRVLVATGTASQCSVTPAEVLTPVIRTRAHGLFLLHNHPTGVVTPSSADRAFTQQLQDACRVLGVRLEDHLVIAGHRWHSVVSGHAGVLTQRATPEPGQHLETHHESGKPSPC